MYTVRLAIFAASAASALASSPAIIPLSFEQRDATDFVARSGDSSVRFELGRIQVGGIVLRFEHARADAWLEGLGPAVPVTYISAASRRTFPQFPKLAIRGLYRGIDAIFYGNEGRLEYDLEVAPGASTAHLRLRFDNARRLRLTPDGTLIVQTAAGELRQLPPVVRQAGRRVPARYERVSANEAAIRLGRYDRRQRLTIDPVLVYSKYFSGSKNDLASLVATDPQGNVYVAGTTTSPDFLADDGAAHTVIPPLLALTNAGQSIARLPVANETAVTAIGGTPDGKILYVGTGGNIYYSSDSGGTWTLNGPIPVPIFTPAASALVINDISVDRFDPSRVYAATNHGLFSTADNGQDWFPRDYALSGDFEGNIQATAVTVSQVDHTLLYATTGRPNYLFKSADAAGTWQLLDPRSPGEPSPNPFPPSQIVFLLAPGGSDLYVINNNGNLVKSADAGATWQKLSGGLADAKIIRMDPNNPANLYVLNGRGVLKSTDGGVTFTLVNPPGVFPGIQVQGMTFEPASRTLYAAVNSSIYASTDQGATWQTAPLAPAGFETRQSIGGRVLLGIVTPPSSYLVKFDPNGPRLLYSTFFVNSPVLGITALQVDGQGSAYLAGNTFEQNFPGVHQLSPTAPPPILSSYIAKLTPDGTNFAYLSTLGASKGLVVTAMAVDSADAVYLTGATAASNFPIAAGAFQPTLPSAPCTRAAQQLPFEIVNLNQWAYVSKISPDGASLVYSTFLGGACGSRGQAIAVNSAGEAFVGGYTTTPDMPFTTLAFQGTFPGDPNKAAGYPNTLGVGFAARLSAAGDKLLAGTFVGGGYLTNVNAIAVDPAGNPLLTGSTWGIATGGTPGAYQSKVVYQCMEPISIGPALPPSQGTDAFLLKLDPGLSKAAFLTYLGGACADSANSVALDPNGNVWLSGISNSGDFPLVAPFEAKNGGAGFVSELSADGSRLLFSTFADAVSMAVDPHESVYLAGTTSYTPAPKAIGLGTAELTRIDPGPNAAIEIDSIAAIDLNVNTVGTISFGSPLAPGQLVRVEGHNLGPATKVDTQLDSSQQLPFTAAGTRVLFDGNPAPLISVQDSEVVCFVPFEVKPNRQAMVQVITNTGPSNVLRHVVFPTSSHILAVINQDGTMNSADNPAPVGSVISVYVSGLGQTNPPGVDGQVSSTAAAVPVAQLTVFAGGLAKPQFVGAAVGLVAGITQVNVQVQPGNYFHNQTTVTVSTGSATLYVK